MALVDNCGFTNQSIDVFRYKIPYLAMKPVILGTNNGEISN